MTEVESTQTEHYSLESPPKRPRSSASQFTLCEFMLDVPTSVDMDQGEDSRITHPVCVCLPVQACACPWLRTLNNLRHVFRVHQPPVDTRNVAPSFMVPGFPAHGKFSALFTNAVLSNCTLGLRSDHVFALFTGADDTGANTSSGQTHANSGLLHVTPQLVRLTLL